MARLVNTLLAAVSRVNTVAVVVAGWGILVIAAITTYSVFMRYTFGRPDVWSYPLSAYILCFVVFLSVAATLQAGMHVRVDYVVGIVPRPLARVFRAVADLASIAFMALFAWQLWRLFTESLARGRVDETTLGWPLALVQWVLPAGAVLLLLTQLVLVAHRLVSEGDDAGPDARR